MHIAIDARIMNSSTGRYVERLVHYLEEIDIENDYSILMRKKDLSFYTPKNPRFTIREADFPDYSFSEQIGFKKLLDTLKPDLVHFCMPQQPVLYRGKKVTTVQDLTLLKTYNSDKNFLIYKTKQFVGRFVFQYIARSSIKVIVPTKFTGQEYRDFSHIEPEKMVQIYDAADKTNLAPVPYEPLDGRTYIMYVGSESDYKNIRRLIKAHQKLLEKHPGLKLALVGKLTGKNGIPAARNKSWSEKNQNRNVIFTDYVSDEQLAWLYTHCAAYVFPSLMEGFGLPGLEAMLYGAPIASSNATCLPEVYGDAAIYFDPFDVNNIADTVDQILVNPNLKQDLINKGYEQTKKYSWRRMAEETHAVYLEALEK